MGKSEKLHWEEYLAFGGLSDWIGLDWEERERGWKIRFLVDIWELLFLDGKGLKSNTIFVILS